MAHDRKEKTELTDEQIAAEEAFMKGVPRVNIGALVMPGIWGPAHGLWACILFYPIWLFADNTFYAAWSQPSPLSLILAAVVFALLLALQIVFGILSQPYAWHRAAAAGKTKEKYLAQQKIWAVAMVAVGAVFIVVATYYNVVMRPVVGAW